MTETKEAGGIGIEVEVPKKLNRTAKKLAAAGEKLVQIAPAILESKASQQMLAIARMGMLDKVLGYLVTTDKNVHFVRPGIAWDSVQTVPLDVIDDVVVRERVSQQHSEDQGGGAGREDHLLRRHGRHQVLSVYQEKAVAEMMR